MFDPTIFENMKVVLEGAVYDLDLSGRIIVTNRIDRVELSTMSRTYALRFREQAGGGTEAELRIHASTFDLAAELLEMDDAKPGCSLEIRFYKIVSNGEDTCAAIQNVLLDIWSPEQTVKQRISFVYGNTPDEFEDVATVRFPGKIDERVLADFPRLLDHSLLSLERLNAIEET